MGSAIGGSVANGKVSNAQHLLDCWNQVIAIDVEKNSERFKHLSSTLALTAPAVCNSIEDYFLQLFFNTFETKLKVRYLLLLILFN